VANLIPGFSFELSDHHNEKFNQEYILCQVEHNFNLSGQGGYVYRNKFLAFPKGTEFRAPRRMPKPRIYGTQTAVVVCPSGEEIYRNEHCCVKVHFHWDQVGKDKDADDSSCWIRVAQPIAGKSWGAIFIPRVGQEVVVSFLEGNPDKPLIVGCVYNDQYVPPYADSDAMKSCLKLATFKDEEGFNEVRFHDEKD
jgi:type VI secretion system secreted protein VgrG